MRFESLLDRHERGELGQLEAAEMLGLNTMRIEVSGAISPRLITPTHLFGGSGTKGG
jgi:hypothetical protein